MSVSNVNQISYAFINLYAIGLTIYFFSEVYEMD